MRLKDEFNEAVDNVKDAVSESKHRSVAEREQAKRDVAGDALTPGEKIGSAVNQAKNTVQADDRRDEAQRSQQYVIVIRRASRRGASQTGSRAA